jgi:hypothetical protein
MSTVEKYINILTLTSEEIRRNLAVGTWNPENKEIAKRELDRRGLEESLRISEENLVSTQSLTKATWALLYITVGLAVISIISLIISIK